MDADDRCVFERVDDEVAAVGARNDGAGQPPEPLRVKAIVDAKFVLVQVDDELESPAGEDALPRMRRHVAERPEIFDELGEGWSRRVRSVQHRVALRDNGRAVAGHVGPRRSHFGSTWPIPAEDRSFDQSMRQARPMRIQTRGRRRSGGVASARWYRSSTRAWKPRVCGVSRKPKLSRSRWW